METFSALLTICAGNSPVTGESHTQKPVTRSFDGFFDLRLNKRLSKQSWVWLYEKPSRSLWRHCNDSNRTNTFLATVIPFHSNKPVAQIPQCTCPISHNVPFCNISVSKCCIVEILSAALWDLWDWSIECPWHEIKPPSKSLASLGAQSACQSISNQFGILTAHVNSLRPRQNGRHFADDMFNCISLNENLWIPIEISLKFVPKGSINNKPALFQIMAWHRPGDKPLSEPMRVNLLTHICVTRPQWVLFWHNKLIDIHELCIWCESQGH